MIPETLNYRDILLISFFINNNIFFLINIYSDSLLSALKYLKDTEIDISNILIMTGDFNTRDSFWDSLYPHYSTHSDLLIDIMDSLSLGLSYPTNSVINLIFLRYSSEELNNHSIHPEWRLSLDHALLTISILIKKQHIYNRKYSIAKGSAEEKAFIKDMIKDFTTINTSNLMDIKSLKIAINSFILAINKAWEKNSKIVSISRHSKSWLDINCSRNLEKYRLSRSLVD